MPAALLLLIYGVPYALRARTLKRRGRPVPVWRIATFAAGLGVLAVAVGPPLASLDDERLTAHMAQHVLLGDLAPMLLVIGCTGPMLSPLLRTRGFRRLRRLSHPVPALAIWLAALYAWHLPAAYEAALHHSAVHLLQHTCFFLAGLNLWVALLGPLPKPAWFIAPAKLGYVVVYWLGGAALGAALVFSGTVFYDTYAAHEGAAALGDQSSAGAIMMVEQAVVATCMVCWLFGVLWREASERQELVELAESRGVVLDEDRVARAVAAGRTAAVRRRITEGRRA